jgi:hypothetical protein
VHHSATLGRVPDVGGGVVHISHPFYSQACQRILPLALHHRWCSSMARRTLGNGGATAVSAAYILIHYSLLVACECAAS